MKKIAIVLFVAAAALAGCSKKNANTTPTTSGGSAMGSGDMGSAAAPAGSGDMGAPAGGAGSGGM